MIIIQTKSITGYNDFLPVLSKIFIINGESRLQNFAIYRKNMKIFFVINTLLFVGYGVLLRILENSTLSNFLIYILAISYAIYVVWRLNVLRYENATINYPIKIKIASPVIWAERFFFDGIGVFVFYNISSSSPKEYYFIPVFFFSIAFIFLLLPFLNYFEIKINPEKYSCPDA